MVTSVSTAWLGQHFHPVAPTGPPGQGASEGRGGHCAALWGVTAWSPQTQNPKLDFLPAGSNCPSMQGWRTPAQTRALVPQNDKVPPTHRRGCGTPHKEPFRRLQVMSSAAAKPPCPAEEVQGILTCYTRTRIDPTVHCSPEPLAKVTASAPILQQSTGTKINF